ncbi:g7848 [Coccomyxa elongata]
MLPQSLRRSSSGASASSYDSLEDFLSEFEVVNKEDTAQNRPGIPLPSLSSATRSFLRPPRPSVRLTTHPYQTSRQARKPPQHGAYHEPAPSAYPGSSQGYQQLALLPIPEPEHAAAGADKPTLSPNSDASAAKSGWGHLSEAAAVRQLPRQGRHGAAPAQQPRQAALSPSRAPLEEFTEQLQADLGGSLSPPPSPFSPQRSAPLLAPQQHAPARLPAAVSLQQPPATHTVDPAATRAAAPVSAAPRPQELLVPYPVITAPAPTHVQTRPEGGPSQTRQVLLQQQQVSPVPPPLRPPPPAEPSLRDPVPPRPTPQPSGSSSIPKSPMPSTLRMSQQVLRKKPKDFESELLDRLLNSNPPSAPAAVPGASSPVKPAFSALHVPVSRALLVTVILALMGIPVLLFMGGWLQAQHHIRSHVYVGAVSALTSSGEPVNTFTGNALPGGHGVDNVTGRMQPSQEFGHPMGASPPEDAGMVDVEEHSAKHKRSQIGLRLLSLRVTLSVREVLSARGDPPDLEHLQRAT